MAGEVDVKFAQITPSAGNATTATQFLGVQGGATDNLFTPDQAFNAPFLASITGAVTRRGSATRWADVVNVLDFGATGDGSTDDTAAINAAIAAAGTKGTVAPGAGGKGCIVFFPTPSGGSYVVSGPLFNNVAGSVVQLVGTGHDLCRLQTPASVIGGAPFFVIDQNDGSSGGANRLGKIQRIDGFFVFNSQTAVGFNATTGCIRFNNPSGTGAPCSIVNCKVTGWNGIVCTSNSFNTLIMNCGYLGSANTGTTGARYGTVGFQIGQVELINCNSVTAWVAFMTPGGDTVVQSQGPYLFGCRCEVCFMGLFAGTTATAAATAGLMGPTNVACQGLSVIGIQFEQTNIPVTLGNCTAGMVNGIYTSANVGIELSLSNIVGSGTTVTCTVSTVTPSFTLDNLGWTSGTRNVQIKDTTYGTALGSTRGALANPPGTAWVLATRTSSTTFQYQSTTTGAVGALPTFVTQIPYALRMGQCIGMNVMGYISNTPRSNMGIAAVDLFGNGNHNQQQNTLTGITTGAVSWIMPSAANKASFEYINCDNPAGAQLDATPSGGLVSGMLFANLPGQPNVNQMANWQPLLGHAFQLYGPREGMTYQIVDSTAAAAGNFGSTITIGGGTNRVWLRASQVAFNNLASVSDGTGDASFVATIGANFTASVSGTTALNVSSVDDGGFLSVGDTVSGSVTAGTTISAFGTGTGGIGTYTLAGNSVATVPSRAMTTTSSVVNVISMNYGTITVGTSPATLLDIPSQMQQRTLTSFGTGSGGVGTYNFTGGAFGPTTTVGNAGSSWLDLMGSGKVGQVLTLHGATTTGTFVPGQMVGMEGNVWKVLNGPTGAPPQYNLQTLSGPGNNKFVCGQALNAPLWTIIG